MGKTILIVEDEIIVADDLRHIVMKLGYTFLARVATGLAAVEKAKELQPDVILMDIRLRGSMTGLEAAKAILEQRPTAIVFLSAFGPDAPLAQGCAYVAKPFSLEQLRHGIEAVIREREACQPTSS